MAFVNKILTQLFPNRQSVASKYKAPLVSEQIKRGPIFLQGYHQWRNSGDFLPHLEQLKKAYEFKKLKMNHRINFHVFESPQSNGFYFTYSDVFGKEPFNYMFDYLKDRMLNKRYYLYNSGREIHEQEEHIKTVETHYLKPQNEDVIGILSQEYGNIHIEHVMINDRSSYIKFMANVYSDSKYKKHKPFEELMEHLLDLTDLDN